MMCVSVTVVIFINIIAQSVVFLSLYRARFESLCFSLFQQSLYAIDRVLATSNVTKDKVDQVTHVHAPGKLCGIIEALLVSKTHDHVA